MRTVSETRQRIILLAKQPEITKTDIGKEVGLSRERVRQILLDEDLFLPRKRKHCKHCGVPLPEYSTKPYCPDCKRKYEEEKKERVWGEYSCHYCGKKIYREKADVKRKKRVFCNRQCVGRWLGKTYGYKNMGKGRRKTEMPEYQIVGMNEVPLIFKQRRELVELAKAAVELEENKALKVSCSSRSKAGSLTYRIRRYLVAKGYEVSTCRRGTTVFVWGVKKKEE